MGAGKCAAGNMRPQQHGNGVKRESEEGGDGRDARERAGRFHRTFCGSTEGSHLPRPYMCTTTPLPLYPDPPLHLHGSRDIAQTAPPRRQFGYRMELASFVGLLPIRGNDDCMLLPNSVTTVAARGRHTGGRLACCAAVRGACPLAR